MNKSLKNKIIFILQVLFSIVFIMNGYPQAGKAKLKINSNRKYGMIQGGTVKLKADMVLTEHSTFITGQNDIPYFRSEIIDIVSVDNNNLFALSGYKDGKYNYNILKSSDAGNSWIFERGLNFPDKSNLVGSKNYHFFDSLNIIVLTENRSADNKTATYSLMKSNDGGFSWNIFENNIAGISSIIMDVYLYFFNKNDGILIYYQEKDRIRLQKTSDGGKTWFPVDFPYYENARLYNIKFINTSKWICRLVFKASDPANNTYLMLKTSNSGSTWNEFSYGNILPADGKYKQSAVDFFGDSLYFSLLTKEHIKNNMKYYDRYTLYKSGDFGITWKAGSPVSLSDTVINTETKLFGKTGIKMKTFGTPVYGYEVSRLYKTEDKGRSWTHVGLLYYGFNSVFFTKGGEVIIDNNSESFEKLNSYLTTENIISFKGDINCLEPLNDNVILGAGLLNIKIKENITYFYPTLTTEYYNAVNSISFSDSITGIAISGSQAYKTTNGGIKWDLINHEFNTDLNDVKYINNQKIIICGNQGIIFLSPDNGINWTSIVSNTTKNLIKIKFVNDTIGFIVGEAGTILKTENAGETWLNISNPSNSTLFDIDFIDEKYGLIVGENGIILKTDDKGATWNKAISPSNRTIKCVSFGYEKVSMIGNIDGNIYKSEDYGTTWIIVDTLEGSGNQYSSINCITSYNEGFYLAGEHGQLHYIEFPQNISYEWSPSELFSNNSEKSPEIVLTDTTQIIVKALYNNIEATGSITIPAHPLKSWQNVLNRSITCGNETKLDFNIEFPQVTLYIDSVNLNDVVMLNENNGFLVGDNGVIYKTIDSWNTYEIINSGTNSNLYAIDFKEDLAIIGGEKGTVLISTDYENWQLINIPVNDDIKDIYIVDKQAILAAGTNGLFIKSLDGGQNWDKINLNSDIDMNSVYFIDNNNGFLAGKKSTLMITADAGNTWEYINQVCHTQYGIEGLSPISFMNPGDFIKVGFYLNKGYVIGNNVILESVDNGKTWYTFSGIPVNLIKTGLAIGNNKYVIQKENNDIELTEEFPYYFMNELHSINSLFSCSNELIYGVGNNGMIFKWGKFDNIKYKWSPAEGLNNDTLFSPMANPKRTTEYTLTVSSPYFNTHTTVPINVDVQNREANLQIYDTVTCGQNYLLDGSAGLPWSQLMIKEFRNCNVYFFNDSNWFMPDQQLETTNKGLSWDFSSRVYGNMKNLYFVDSNIWLASMVESFNGKVYDTLIMRTTNSGKDWQWILSSNLVNKFYFFDKENGIAVCKGGNIIKTEDSGNSWTKLVKISNANLSDIEFINESKGFVITEQGELFVTTDKGLNWKDAKLNSPYVLNDILFTDEYNGYIFGTAGCVFITRDGGNQWSNSTINKKVHFLKAFFVNNSTGYVVGTNGSIYKTNNKGISWIKMFTGINNDLTSVYFINENTGFAGGNQILLKYNESEGTIYTWENGSDISDIHSPLQSITVTDDHFYKASIIASQGCGDSEISYNIKAYKGELSVKDISKEILCGDKVVIDLKVDCPNCIDLEYEWSPATGLNGTLIKNPIINTDVSKEYRVKVTNPSACGGEQTATANVKIQIIPPVILAVKLAEDKVRLSIKGKYDSYLWSTGQTTPTITVGYGTYTAFVTAANGCSSETEPYVFNNSNPDNITNAEVNEVLLYPNPADDIIYFALPLENSKCKVEIYNLQSQKVSHFVVYQSYGNIPVSALASGLYFIHFIGENKKFVHKFYKQ